MSQTRRLSLIDRYLPLWIALVHVAFWLRKRWFTSPAALALSVRE
ncbi:MAG: hypothetical protein ABSB49_00375 [Polyangia bacterium]|jgi:hypothetical protein